jgi:hypothetical protein
MTIDLHVYIHSVPQAPDTRLDDILRLLNVIVQEEKEIMADLTNLTAQVKANTDAEDSAVVLLNSLSALIVSMKNDPAQLQQLATDLKSHADVLAAAVVANTPAAETPPANP